MCMIRKDCTVQNKKHKESTRKRLERIIAFSLSCPHSFTSLHTSGFIYIITKHCTLCTRIILSTLCVMPIFRCRPSRPVEVKEGSRIVDRAVMQAYPCSQTR